MTYKNKQTKFGVSELYAVEKIIDRRVTEGKIEYLIKYKNFSSNENTWEIESCLNCQDLIDAFEKERIKQNMVKETENLLKKPNGFDKGYVPEKIIGATDEFGQLMFLMKWVGITDTDLVPSKDANVKCPQIVIKFYEERLTWQRDG